MPVDIFRADVAECKWSLRLGFSNSHCSCGCNSNVMLEVCWVHVPLPFLAPPPFETGSCCMSLVYLENRLALNFPELAPPSRVLASPTVPHGTALKCI